MNPLHGCKLALSLPLRPNDSTAFAASDRPQFGGIRPPCLGPAAVSCDCQSQFAVRSFFMWRARHISLASASRWLSFAHPGSVTALQKWAGVMRTFKRNAVCGSRSRTRWDRLALLGFGAMTASSMGQTVLHVDLFAGKGGDGSLRRAGGFCKDSTCSTSAVGIPLIRCPQSCNFRSIFGAWNSFIRSLSRGALSLCPSNFVLLTMGWARADACMPRCRRSFFARRFT